MVSHQAIPFIKYAFAIRAQKPFHCSLTSSDTGGVDDHLTMVGWGVHKMVRNIMLNQKMHSSTCMIHGIKSKTTEICRIHYQQNQVTNIRSCK